MLVLPTYSQARLRNLSNLPDRNFLHQERLPMMKGSKRGLVNIGDISPQGGRPFSPQEELDLRKIRPYLTDFHLGTPVWVLSLRLRV